MGIGGSVLVMAIGAILAFAVHWHVSGVDLRVVGWILMGAGALWLIVLLTLQRRRRYVRTAAVSRPGPVDEVTEVRRDYEE